MSEDSGHRPSVCEAGVAISTDDVCDRRSRVDAVAAYLGGCGALDQEGRRVERSLEATGALAVCGYRRYVDWMTSTAFELMLLALLQENAPTIGGMRAARKKIRAEAATLVRNLGFQMAIRKGRKRPAST